MSNRNDTCPRCGNEFHYDGHLRWCDAIQELEDRIAALEDHTHVVGLIDRTGLPEAPR